MFTKFKIKLHYLFLTGISVILFITILLLGYVSVTSVYKLGHYAIEKNKSFLTSEFASVLSSNTANNSNALFSAFKEVFDCAFLLARETEKLLQNKKVISSPTDTFNLINYLKKNNLYTHVTSPPISTVCYYGKEKITLKTWGNINNLLSIRTFLLKLNRILPFSQVAWITIFDENYTIFSGNIEKELSSLPRKTLNDYLNVTYTLLKNRYPYKKHIKDFAKWGYWTNPFIDFISNKKTIAVKFPVFNKSGKLVGAACIYVDIEAIINSSVNSHLLTDKDDDEDHLLENNYNIIFTEDSQIIYASPPLYKLLSIPLSDDLTEPFKPNVYKLSKINNPFYKEIKEIMQKEQIGCKTITINNKLYFFAFSKIKANNWICAKLYPFEAASKFIKKTEAKTKYLTSELATYFLLISILCLIIAIILSSLFFNFFIHKPIKKLCNAVKLFHKGNFENKLGKSGISELQDLTDSYNDLGFSLNKYMKNLKEEVRNRQILETEISIAAEIQKSVMPKIENIPKREEFELAAKLKPAKHVAGDFFDYFFIDDNRIVLIIGDVSGKGVSAAFFMTTAKVVIKNICFRTDDTATILRKANKQLIHNNETGIFVTVFLCIYNLNSGEFTYSNAGHHEALIMTENSNITEFGLQVKPPLGFFKDSTYLTNRKTLNIGETIILYTDGITEAFDPDKEIFLGKDKFFNILKKNKKNSLNEFIRSITDFVIEFEDNILFDDITILAFKRKK